ncbi:hypothetical protein QAD02_005141 [Eretmocerus hayati]|uniref:Uncharacterized protein n=1 Tax=Eretmocerus hayati TaxID=131215 RepID=A0ACC2NU95_9HYME|nr:hypothetical protein QAD02_005141 [Eretmocerus hayati]
MLFQAILITLFASQSTRASHKDSILLQKWSIPSWEAVRDTDLFEVDQDLEDVAYAIFAKDGYLDTHLGVCPNNSRYIERIQDISHRIKKLKIYSELVSHGLLTIVQELRTYDGSEELLSNDSKTEGILRKYFLDGRQFLIEFRNNILSDPNDNSSLVTEYKVSGNLKLNRTSLC